jgi:hypothetical protein
MGTWGEISPQRLRYIRRCLAAFAVAAVGFGVTLTGDYLSWRWLSKLGFGVGAGAIIFGIYLTVVESWRVISIVVDVLGGEKRRK